MFWAPRLGAPHLSPAPAGHASPAGSAGAARAGTGGRRAGKHGSHWQPQALQTEVPASRTRRDSWRQLCPEQQWDTGPDMRLGC